MLCVLEDSYLDRLVTDSDIYIGIKVKVSSMVKYIIIGILIFNVGFVLGAGYGHIRRDDE